MEGEVVFIRGTPYGSQPSCLVKEIILCSACVCVYVRQAGHGGCGGQEQKPKAYRVLVVRAMRRGETTRVTYAWEGEGVTNGCKSKCSRHFPEGTPRDIRSKVRACPQPFGRVSVLWQHIIKTTPRNVEE